MSNPTTPFGWQMPTNTDLVTDLPADFEVFGQAVATSMADLLGGSTGQVLAKNSNTDMDFVWVTSDDANAIQNTIVDAKGDLITATAADTPARLASSGVNGQILMVDTSTATGLKWAPAPGALSFATGYNYVTTAEDTTSTTFTNLTTTQAVTVTTGTKAMIILKAVISNQATYGNTGGTLGVTVSGASTVTASDEYSVGMNVYGPASNFQINARGSILLTGLTAGSNTFTMKFKDTNGFTSRFFNRSITVIDMGS